MSDLKNIAFEHICRKLSNDLSFGVRLGITRKHKRGGTEGSAQNNGIVVDLVAIALGIWSKNGQVKISDIVNIARLRSINIYVLGFDGVKCCIKYIGGCCLVGHKYFSNFKSLDDLGCTSDMVSVRMSKNKKIDLRYSKSVTLFLL